MHSHSFVCKMTCYVSSGILSPAHSLTLKLWLLTFILVPFFVSLFAVFDCFFYCVLIVYLSLSSFDF